MELLYTDPGTTNMPTSTYYLLLTTYSLLPVISSQPHLS